jgi:hypothetical protein
VRWSAVAILAAAFAYAWVMQGVGGYPQNAQYALVRALASGTAQVDRTRHEVGELGTLDVRYFEGHYYSNKAPALAFVTVPAFLVLDAVGAAPPGDPSRMLWALGLVGVVLPAVLLLLVVRWVADRVEPGFGTGAALILGLATLVLPFTTLFYNHVLGALLLFAAFAVLFAERRSRDRPWLVAAGGVLAGLAVTSEYVNVLGALVLLGYALRREGFVRRALLYGGGVLVGVVPLLAYNWWAFGSVTHNSYSGRLILGADELGRDVGPTAKSPEPSLGIVLENLASTTGLLTLAPVVGCGAVGTVLLWKRGWRAESLVVGTVSGLFLAYVSSYGSSFGGYGPGPRYLIPILPFLAFPLVAALRAFPVTTLALAAVSAVVMGSVTATHALAGYDGDWLSRFEQRAFASTAASLVGVTGWYTILPFFAAVLVAALAAALATPALHVSRADTALALAAVLGWALAAAAAPRTAALGGESDRWQAYWAVALLCVVAAAAYALVRSRAAAAGPAEAAQRAS